MYSCVPEFWRGEIGRLKCGFHRSREAFLFKGEVERCRPSLEPYGCTLHLPVNCMTVCSVRMPCTAAHEDACKMWRNGVGGRRPQKLVQVGSQSANKRQPCFLCLRCDPLQRGGLLGSAELRAGRSPVDAHGGSGERSGCFPARLCSAPGECWWFPMLEIKQHVFPVRWTSCHESLQSAPVTKPGSILGHVPPVYTS